MAIWQKEIQLAPHSRGFHLIDKHIISQIEEFPQFGLLHLFIKHTSAALTINENADPSVRHDFEQSFNHLIKENESFYTHIYEGSDDMPAHIKTALIGNSITIPISNYQLNLGTWQGIYLCEFRNQAPKRSLIITIYF